MELWQQQPRAYDSASSQEDMTYGDANHCFFLILDHVDCRSVLFVSVGKLLVILDCYFTAYFDLQEICE